MRFILCKNSVGEIDETKVRMISDEGIISDVPNDEGNRDWNTYQKWLSEGNTPEGPEE
jgi:hypothetical protein